MESLGVEGTLGWVAFGVRRALLAGPSLYSTYVPIIQ